MITLVNNKIWLVKSAPENIFDTALKNVIFFTEHLVFEISVCFRFQLPSLPQAREQQKVALFWIVT